jgi:7-keto-8-aminopelargonate synthetase-like enzyme
VEERIELQMGTLGKALGVSGGYVACSRAVHDLLVNKARSFIFSTAPPPAVAWAAKEAVELVKGLKGDALRAALGNHVRKMGSSLQKEADDHRAAIFPLVIGDEGEAMRASEAMLDAGFLIPAIRYPTVAKGTARLRLTLSAGHESVQIERLVACLHDRVPQCLTATQPPA